MFERGRQLLPNLLGDINEDNYKSLSMFVLGTQSKLTPDDISRLKQYHQQIIFNRLTEKLLLIMDQPKYFPIKNYTDLERCLLIEAPDPEG